MKWTVCQFGPPAHPWLAFRTDDQGTVDKHDSFTSWQEAYDYALEQATVDRYGRCPMCQEPCDAAGECMAPEQVAVRDYINEALRHAFDYARDKGLFEGDK